MSDTLTVTEDVTQVTVEAGDIIQVPAQPAIQVIVSADGSVTVLEQSTTVTVEVADALTVTGESVEVTVGGADHPSGHPLTGSEHSVSGLTVGDVLTALTPTSYDWAAPAGGPHDIAGVDHTGFLPHFNLSDVNPNDHHSQAHAIGGVDHSGAISAAQHGTLGSGNLHPEYAELANTETISGVWTFSAIHKSNPAAVGIVYEAYVAAQVHPQLRLSTDQGVSLGPGTAAPIMSMRRATGLVSGIGANAGWEFVRSTAVTPKLYGVKSTDTQPLWIFGDSSGTGILCQEGPGGAVAPDTKWGRVAAGVVGFNNAIKILGSAGAGFAEFTGQTAIPASGSGVRLYSAANALLSYILATGERVGPLGLLSATFFNGRPTARGEFAVSGGANQIDASGLMAGPTKILSGGTESISISAPEGYPQYQQTTPATINSDVGYQWPLNVEFGNAAPSLVYAVELAQTTDIRAFVGFTDQTLATMLGSDNPAGNYVGMQFSSARGDTNWQFVYKDGTTQTVVDSGAPPGTDPKAIRIRVLNSAPEIEWTILSYTGQASVAPATVTTGLPASATQVRVVAGLRNLVASAKSIRHSHGFEQWNAAG